MPVADETDAVDDARKWRVTALGDSNGFGADHRDRNRQACIAANRLPPAGQYEMTVIKGGFYDIRSTDEFGDETILGCKVDLTRRADLGNRPLLHHDHAIAEFHGLGLIVGHIDCGDPERPQQAVQFAAQPVAQRRIERGQRFVQQQDARPDRDRARQRHALALAAGELIDATVLQPGDVGQRDQFGHARCALLVSYAADLEAIADIVGHAHVGKQRVGLEHHADIAPLDRHWRHVLAVEQHPAASVGQFEAGDDAQHGGLAAAGGTEQHQRFAAADIERCRFERTRAVRKGLAAGLDTHRGAMSGLRTHRFCSFSANNCMATKSGMIITKKIKV